MYIVYWHLRKTLLIHDENRYCCRWARKRFKTDETGDTEWRTVSTDGKWGQWGKIAATWSEGDVQDEIPEGNGKELEREIWLEGPIFLGKTSKVLVILSQTCSNERGYNERCLKKERTSKELKKEFKYSELSGIQSVQTWFLLSEHEHVQVCTLWLFSVMPLARSMQNSELGWWWAIPGKVRQNHTVPWLSSSRRSSSA